MPTGISFDRLGRAYVSFLSPFPFTQRSARIDRVTSDRITVAARNRTMLVDVLAHADGSVYVLEMSQEFTTTPPPPRYQPNSGRIIRLTTSGAEVIQQGLNFPTKMLFGPDNSIYVTNNASFAEPGGGQVLKISLARPAAPAAQPAPPTTTAPAPVAPRPAGAPVQVPAALPRTGDAGGPEGLAFLGAFAVLLGFGVRRATRRPRSGS